MIRSRLMFAEFIRVITEMVIHQILFGFDSDGIQLELNIHSHKGNADKLYNAAVDLGWKGDGGSGFVWVCSNYERSNTTIYSGQYSGEILWTYK